MFRKLLFGCLILSLLVAVTTSLANPAASVGDFTIEYDGGALTVTSGGVVRWSSVAGSPFLHAGIAHLEAEENRGSFLVEEEIDHLCTVQTVGAVNAGANDVTVTGQLSGDPLCATNYTITFTQPLDGHLQFEATFDNVDVNYVEMVGSSSAEEAFFGFGEQNTHINLKGHEVPVLSEEGGVGRGHPIITPIIEIGSPGSGGDAYTSYYSAPHYITSESKSLFLENTEYSVFDMRSADRVLIRLHSPVMTGRILAADSLLEQITLFTDYAGRFPNPPDWLNNGAIVGMQGGDAFVLDILAELQARETPIAAFWLQDWVGKRQTLLGSQLWWNWEVDFDRYPNWYNMVDQIEDAGGKVMCYVNPFLVDVSVRPIAPRRNLFQEAIANGYAVQDSNGDPLFVTNTTFNAIMVDLTNPAAFDWMKQAIKDLVIDEGRCSGWMHDFAEALPFEADLYSGVDAATYHNQYTVDWARLAREVVQEEGLEDEIIFFNRSGYTTSPRYASLLWQGDQLVTWDKYDGLHSAIVGMLSGGYSGISLNHSDIGGYTTAEVGNAGYKRSKELLLRWMEMSAFTTAFRTHEGLDPINNKQFYTDDDTYAAFDRFARVYRALTFYREGLFDDAEQLGLPVTRHLTLNYQDDPETYNIDDQFMLGDEILVAPIVYKTIWAHGWKKVYFPDADNTTWINIWNCNRYGAERTTTPPPEIQAADPATGARESVRTPIGQPPVFVKVGSDVGQQFILNLIDEGVLDHICETNAYLPIVPRLASPPFTTFDPAAQP